MKLQSRNGSESTQSDLVALEVTGACSASQFHTGSHFWRRSSLKNMSSAIFRMSRGSQGLARFRKISINGSKKSGLSFSSYGKTLLTASGLVALHSPLAYNDNTIDIPVKKERRLLAIQSTLKQKEYTSLDVLKHYIEALLESTLKMGYYTKKFLRYLSRVLTIGAISAPLVVMGPIAYATQIEMIKDATLSYGLWAMEMLGPAFIKLGQWASTRPDLYPPHVTAKLASLQDDVKTVHTMATVERTLRENLGDNWKELLELEPEPIGAGCIAQVFKGKIIDSKILQEIRNNTASKDSGIKDVKNEQSVAVKVIHPHVKDLLNVDMELLTIIANMFDCIPSLKLLSIGQACRNFCRCMEEQLDMKLEAHNLSVFRKKWTTEDWASFPEPINKLTTTDVLVETLMEGTSIVKFMELKDTIDGSTSGIIDQSVKKLKARLSDLSSSAMIKMIFFDNFIHGDCHPGNILVHIGPDGEPHLNFLDCGIVYKSENAVEHDNVINICLAFMKHDGREAGRLMMDNSSLAPKGREAFMDGIQELIDMAETQNYFEHISDYVSRICELARIHNVKLDPNYFQIAMALKVSEGISLALDKELDLISKCLPVILKAKAMEKMGLKPSIGKVADEVRG